MTISTQVYLTSFSNAISFGFTFKQNIKMGLITKTTVKATKEASGLLTKFVK